MALQELKAKMGLGPATGGGRKELPAKDADDAAAKSKDALSAKGHSRGEDE